ncbi:Ctr copper transporter [Amylostereum chailletii]|nr:Ctr copper transporter [Amylostereum chailletii]
MMVPYLHFTGSDHLFFKSWVPSGGSVAGAAIALIFLAMAERLLAGLRGITESHWRREYVIHKLYDTSSSGSPVEADELPHNEDQQALVSRRARVIAPFIVSHDVTRGLMYALQALLSYILMLASMTFQAAYIIAIAVGLGLGEMLFGRFATGGPIHH